MAIELSRAVISTLHEAMEYGQTYLVILSGTNPYMGGDDYYYLSDPGRNPICLSQEITNNRLTAILLMLAAEEELSDYPMEAV